MSGSIQADHSSLRVSDFEVDPKVAHLVSPDLAYRYHTLPIANVDGQFTVVMADPTDEAAKAVVQSILKSTPRYLKGDSSVIDTQLSQLWPLYERPTTRMLVLQEVKAGKKFHNYSHAIGGLIHADEIDIRFHPKDGGSDDFPPSVSNPSYDLVIVQVPDPPPSRGLLSKPYEWALLQKIQSTTLLIHQPSWPIRRILWVPQCTEMDFEAVRWLDYLAHSRGCQVKLLVCTPPVPSIYGGLKGMSSTISDILETNSTLGKHLRRLLSMLQNGNIHAGLQLLHGVPAWELMDVMQSGPVDLLVMSPDPGGRLSRLFQESMAGRVVCQGECPVLYVKSRPAA
jgi:nucleotide-binding universal stress UspA family protein